MGLNLKTIFVATFQKLYYQAFQGLQPSKTLSIKEKKLQKS